MNHRWKLKLFGEGKCDKCGEKAYHVCKEHGERLCSSDYRKFAFEDFKAGIEATRE